MKRVLIVNKCGLLSALPTISEYQSLEFVRQNKIVALVDVSDEDNSRIRASLGYVRVLGPDLPRALAEPGWL